MHLLNYRLDVMSMLNWKTISLLLQYEILDKWAVYFIIQLPRLLERFISQRFIRHQIIFDITIWGKLSLFCEKLFWAKVISSLYWLVLCFHAMEYISDQAKFLPHPSPPPHHILSAQTILFIYSNTLFLHDSHSHFQTVISSFICG